MREVDDPETQDMGVVWKDLTPADFPEAWRKVEDAEDMGFATLVELMVEHLEDHQLRRVVRAANREECRRNMSAGYNLRHKLQIGHTALMVAREVTHE
jgi:hypothetical protein